MERSDLLHIVSLLLLTCSSIVGNLPYWTGVYVPIFMPYHYYPTAMAIGLYSCHRFHQKSLAAAVVAVVGAGLAFVWGTIWLNEYAQSGTNYIFGTRNYSHIAGSNTSLLITTTKTDSDAPTYSYMNTLDTVVMCFLIVLNPIIIINTSMRAKSLKCLKCGETEMCSEDSGCNFPGIFAACAMGIGVSLYYFFGGLVMLLQSVIPLNPVASPNPFFVYLSFATMGIPTIDEIKASGRVSIARLFTIFLFVGWIWSLVLASVSMAQISSWRGAQTPYISAVVYFCPTEAIVSTLTPVSGTWGNFSLPGFVGVDGFLFTNNTDAWTPELFATYTCADYSLTLVQIFLSLLGWISVNIYLQKSTRTEIAREIRYTRI